MLLWLQIRMLHHPNVNKLIGAFTDAGSNGLVWMYCNRGSLHDVLLDEDIKLDWVFNISFLTEITKVRKSQPPETHINIPKAYPCITQSDYFHGPLPENIIYRRLTLTDVNMMERRKEGNVLFNDALNTFCLRLCGIRVKDHSDSEEETMGYSVRLKARVLFYVPSYRQLLLHQLMGTGWSEK